MYVDNFNITLFDQIEIKDPNVDYKNDNWDENVDSNLS